MVTLRTETDVRDFVRGCTFMGTGGGGPQKAGLKFLMEDVQKGMNISWVDPFSIPDDAWTCVPYYMGSIAPFVPETKIKMEQRGLVNEVVNRELVQAVEEMQKFLGIKISALVPMELGGINTPAPLDAALHLNMLMVDGDYSGRAVPEIAQASPVLFGHDIAPVISCDRWGNVLTINKCVNNQMVEIYGKSFSTSAFVICGQCGLVLKGKDMKKAIIPGTLTKCYQIGRTIREACEQGKDPVQAVINETEGWLLFKGEVTGKDWEDKDGYLQGTCTIKGIDEFANHNYKIWYKNENHITWLDNKPHVLSPDLVQVVELDTAEPITNTDLKEGDKVAVVGMKNEKFRTEKGLELLGPKHFGFDYEYIPIEEIMQKGI
jgi:DUF917 family protein